MKSARVIRSNFLERIADPASQFYPDYLSYRNREITQDELVARLPHVAMLGDSACMGTYISSPWSTFWRAHTRRGSNWFPQQAEIAVDTFLSKLCQFFRIDAIRSRSIGDIFYNGAPVAIPVVPILNAQRLR